MYRNVAVILAGGVGARSGLDYPKQFLKVAGKEVLAHTVDVFQSHAQIDEIAIVAHGSYVERVEDMVRANNWAKVKKVLHGGEERYVSSLSAIRAYAATPDVNLIFHDAVRPLLTPRVLDRVIESLASFSAVDTVIPSSDTIVEVSSEGDVITDIPDRNRLRRGQTPQGFHLDVIAQAYELATKDPNFVVTDDCGVVRKYLPEVEIAVVAGEESNMKLTHPEDIYLLEKLFQVKTHDVSDVTFQEKVQGKVTVVFGGSYGIGKELVDKINELGGLAVSFSRSADGVDVRDLQRVKDSLATVAVKFGKIDFVVCSAAILKKEPLIHMSQDDIDAVIDINFRGMVNVSLAAQPYLQKSRGQLLHFTSSSYTRGRADYSIYSATKAGVVNFVQAIAEEWEPMGIRVNCINPARTRTPMRVENFGVEPEGTLLEASDVAVAAIQTLVGSQTGQVIDVSL